ncbi:hypothetical protein ACT7DF_18755 [Bacillus cereus]
MVVRVRGDVGKGVSGAGSKIDGELIRKYVRDIEIQTNRKIQKNQMEELKSALRNTEYKKDDVFRNKEI